MNSQNDKPTFKKTTGLQARLQQATPMWSLQGSIFQETALQVLDQQGSIAHKTIGKIVNELNAKGDLDAADIPAVVKEAMARWSKLLWTE